MKGKEVSNLFPANTRNNGTGGSLARRQERWMRSDGWYRGIAPAKAAEEINGEPEEKER